MRTGRAAVGRGQVEPLAALAALFAVSVGLSTYALVVADAGGPSDRDVAGPALAAVDDAVTVHGSVRPDRLGRALEAGPTGKRLNATVRADGDEWTVGPPVADHGDRASQRVSVRLEPGHVRPGRLRVVVW